MSYKFLPVDDSVDVYVVGDIHGCYSLLMKELKNIGFNFNKDLLIGVGDLVDRGSENEKCFGLLNKFWFTTVKGNHEDFCYKGMMDDSVKFYHRFPQNGGEWFYNLPEDIMECVGRRLNQLPVLLEVKYRGKNFGFVHADVPVEDWSLLVEMVLKNDTQIDSDRSVIDHCLWSRRIVEMDTVNIAGIDRVFLGHTILPEIKDIGNCTFLDTGGCFSNIGDEYKLSIVKLSDYT